MHDDSFMHSGLYGQRVNAGTTCSCPTADRRRWHLCLDLSMDMLLLLLQQPGSQGRQPCNRLQCRIGALSVVKSSHGGRHTRTADGCLVPWCCFLAAKLSRQTPTRCGGRPGSNTASASPRMRGRRRQRRLANRWRIKPTLKDVSCCL
jgi:hypothetical protein